jgi:prevent-host-death family protein
MKMATISQAKNQFSAYLELVRHGETVIVTDRERPVARIEPIIASAADEDDARLARLERAGVIRRGGVAPSDALEALEPAEPILEADILAVLLEERETSR